MIHSICYSLQGLNPSSLNLRSDFRFLLLLSSDFADNSLISKCEYSPQNTRNYAELMYPVHELIFTHCALRQISNQVHK